MQGTKSSFSVESLISKGIKDPPKPSFRGCRSCSSCMSAESHEFSPTIFAFRRVMNVQANSLSVSDSQSTAQTQISEFPDKKVSSSGDPASATVRSGKPKFKFEVSTI